MNTFSVYLVNNNVETSIGTPIMPLTMAELLDERLDEAQVTVYNSTIAHIEPNSIVKIGTQTGEGESAITKNYYFKVAGDEAVETPNGSEKYKHTLSLVELTKYLDGVVCQSLTFTNTLGRNYTPKNAPLRQYGEYSEDMGGFSTSLLETPILTNQISFSVGDICSQTKQYFDSQVERPSITYSTYESKVTYLNGDGTQGTVYAPDTLTLNVVGTVILDFLVVLIPGAIQIKFQTSIALADNQAATKKWTIKTVCQRCFDLAEPLFGAETPRFSLDTTQANELDKIIAPEFTMAQSTLREQLRVIGGRIHAEPRISEVAWSNGKPTYTIKFDYYGKYSAATLPNFYLRKQYETTLSNYCTQVHTNAVNLVNSLDFTKGTVTMPGGNGYTSLRTEQVNVRADETNGVFKTQLPIYRPQKLMVGIWTPFSQLLVAVNITKYLFEATEYDSQLESYSGGYPYSKCYALRYEKGGKTITGMFFQAPNILSQALENYSIVKILALETGRTEASIQTKLNTTQASLVFQLTYSPIFSTAYTMGKNSTAEPFTMVYNQSNGLIESEYYGENIRGVAMRLGNVDEVRTYKFDNLDQVPKIGECVGDYYISAVNIQFDTFSITATIALTKDFNRISQYIGINSEKRIAEISTKQPYERNIIFTEKLVAAYTEPTEETTIGRNVLFHFKDIFTPETDAQVIAELRPISVAYFARHNEKERTNTYDPVILPVVACNQANKVIMTASFKDNYSAGEKVTYISGGDGVKGYWQQDVRFCDVYGRAKYMTMKMGRSFSSQTNTRAWAFNQPQAIATNAVYIIDTNTSPYLLRKDSRERLATVSYGIEIVSDIPELNIGSGLAKLCRLCYNRSMSEARPHFYTVPHGGEFPYKLDTDIIDYDFASWTDCGEISASVSNNYISFAPVFPDDGIGYVVAMPVVSTEETVIDENGQTTTQTVYSGGEILFSVHKQTSYEDAELEDIYFYMKK